MSRILRSVSLSKSIYHRLDKFRDVCPSEGGTSSPPSLDIAYTQPTRNEAAPNQNQKVDLLRQVHKESKSPEQEHRDTDTQEVKRSQ